MAVVTNQMFSMKKKVFENESYVKTVFVKCYEKEER